MNRYRTMLAVLISLGTAVSAFTQELTAEQKGRAADHLAFLQANFTNFARVTLLPPTNKGETVIQTFKVNDHVIGAHEGALYCGVRFTLPDWLDGNLRWNFFHLNPEARRGQRVNLAWGIFPERGRGFPQTVRRIDPDESVEFWRRYPFTRRVYAHTVARTNLQPGASYGLYFVHYDPTAPNIAFALTIDSERGRKEFGTLDFITGQPGSPAGLGVSPLTSFIQQNWTNFPVVRFLPPKNGTETVFRRFKVGENVIGEFNGRFYSGVRFTVPEWMDGDFEFAFVHLYRSLNELQTHPGYSWGLTAQRGEIRGLEHVERVLFSAFPETQARFPNTEKGYTGTARRENLVPGRTYVLWWGHWWGQVQGVVPDLAFAFTIGSERGYKEFGEITWR